MLMKYQEEKLAISIRARVEKASLSSKVTCQNNVHIYSKYLQTNQS